MLGAARPMVDEGTLLLLAGRSDCRRSEPLGLGAANVVGGFHVLPSFQHASVPPTPIQPGGRGGGQSGSVVVPVERRCRSRSRTTRSRSHRTARSRPCSNRRTALMRRPTPRTQTFPVGATRLLARARQQRRQQGARLVGDVDVRADAARARDHDGAGRSRARRSPRSAGRRSTAPRATRCRTSSRTERARHLEHPEHARSATRR